MKWIRNQTGWLTATAIFLSTVAQPALGASRIEGVLADIDVEPEILIFSPKVAAESFHLRVSGPGGFQWDEVFAAGQAPFFDAADENWNPRPAGSYVYELIATPILSAEVKELYSEIAGDPNREAILKSVKAKSGLPSELPTQSGGFAISGGKIVMGGEKEIQTEAQPTKGEDSATKQVINGDLTVYNSLCVGQDCAQVENYGADSIRLKENNLRIHFDDTSNSGSFPNRDWRIVANDQANGGLSYLGFEDSTAGVFPFRVLAGAGANALYVDAQGDVGLNTPNPIMELHIADGDTPTIRLEQTGASGWTPRTWDIAGNETNWFVRDLADGSALCFRIFASAGDDMLVIRNDRVGVGTDNPVDRFHVRGDNTAPNALVVTAAGNVGVGTSLPRGRFEVAQANVEAPPSLVVTDSGFVGIGTDDPNARLHVKSPDGVDIFQLENQGNVIISRALSQMSDKNAKENFSQVDPQDALERVLAMPITTWNYIGDAPDLRHMGPMAQDFHSAFDLGVDDKHISPLDANGAAFAAIQGLNEKVDEKEAIIENLKKQNEELQTRLEAIERAVGLGN
jgi:hypothetical protein